MEKRKYTKKANSTPTKISDVMKLRQEVSSLTSRVKGLETETNVLFAVVGMALVVAIICIIVIA